MLPILQGRWGVLLLLCLTSGSWLPAQINLPADFAAKLDQHELEFVSMEDQSYRPIRHGVNEFLPEDYALRSRRKRLQVRYLIEPLDSSHYLSYEPELLATRMVMHLGSNDRTAVVTMHELPPEKAVELFRANWAATYYFSPKPVFSDYTHCRMLVLYREGRTMAYEFTLFNEPSEALAEQSQLLQFREEQVVLSDD